MAKYITRIRTVDGDKQIDYNALANLPAGVTDATNTVISPNADYAEVGEWADGNPADEDRLGYFVAVAEVGDNTIKIRKAMSEDDVRGVTVYNPAFSGNASKDKYGEDGELLQQYNYVGVMGIVKIIDNGTCTVNGRCMPADDGTAIPSTNNMGYAVLERVDDTHVLIAVEPGADMIQRVKSDVKKIQDQLGNTEIPHFNLAELGLPTLTINGSAAYLPTDTTEIMAALSKGAVKFTFALNAPEGGVKTFDGTLHSVYVDGVYICGYALNIGVPVLFTMNVVEGFILVGLQGLLLDKAISSINMSNFETNGTIIQTYTDGTTETSIVEFDADGNPIKITDGNGNVTTLTW